MYDLVVLGGGSEGLNVALAAARIGARVAVVKNATPGGECTHSAIVPRTALIAAAGLAHQVAQRRELRHPRRDARDRFRRRDGPGPRRRRRLREP